MSALPAQLPTPRTADPRTAPPLRWGVLAPGGIASSFADAVRRHTAQELVAVGSRSAERARSFADRFGIGTVHDSYPALVEDPQVQAVYVASPHSAHHEHALLAIAAGKHVLVEKAFTQTAAQAAEVAQAAAAAGVVVMEAMWSRFLPHYDVVRQLLADGALGDLVTLTADHGQYFDFDPRFRLFNPELAGGALLDLGIYPVSFASFVQGTPDRIQATGTLASTGVDGQVSAVLSSDSGLQAVVNTTLFAKTPTTASISGTRARIEIAGDFYMPQPVTLIDRDGDRRTWDGNTVHGHEGLAYEAAELARVVADGRTGSDLLPVAETLAIMGTLDELRRQVGAALPGD
ncbi:Gfo/Idh/MocA family protein [Nakamurella deserti]|uniref:Gfo/Idh/MocA family protein n=1 Tax=Nakamurella deserti TaxID=2164074 RepID=UPI00197C7B8A|nr:Gfo/Idh/MocA family oxidoreductase [Nakamurella deserti]